MLVKNLLDAIGDIEELFRSATQLEVHVRNLTLDACFGGLSPCLLELLSLGK